MALQLLRQTLQARLGLKKSSIESEVAICPGSSMSTQPVRIYVFLTLRVLILIYKIRGISFRASPIQNLDMASFRQCMNVNFEANFCKAFIIRQTNGRES